MSIRILTPPVPEFTALTFPRLASCLSAPGPGTVAVGALSDGNPVGLALGEATMDGVRLLSIMVDPPCRRRGIGRALLHTFAVASGERGGKGVVMLYPSRLPSRSALEHLQSLAGWTVPRLACVQLVGFAEAMADVVGRWPGVRRLLDRPGAYRFTPWADLTAADHREVTALLTEDAESPFPDPRAWVGFAPEFSLALRQEERLVGWVIGERANGGLGPMTRSEGTSSVVYRNAYCANSHARGGILIAAYHHAFSRQAKRLGSKSRAIYQTHPGRPAMLALTLRRFAPIALRVDEVMESHLDLAAPDE